MHKQRYVQKKKSANTIRIRMIESFGDYVAGKEYTVDLLLADFLATTNNYAVKV